MVAVEEAEGEPWDVEEPQADEEAASAGTFTRGGAIEMLRGAEFCEILILELIHKFSNKL